MTSSTWHEGLAHRLGIAGYDGQVGARSLVRCHTPLFAIAQRANRNVESRCKFFLADPQRAPDDFDLWRALHTDEIGRRERPIVRIAVGGGLNFLRRHRT